jgi:hypothetical protein
MTADGQLRPPDKVPTSEGTQCRWKAAGAA